MPNKILNTSVASGPPLTISFRVQGDDAYVAILPDKSTVTLAGGASTALTGLTAQWTTVGKPPAGVAHAYDVVLSGKVKGYKGSAGDDLTLEFRFQKLGGGDANLTAHALVDYSPNGRSATAAVRRTSGGGGTGSGGAVAHDLRLLTGFPFQVYDGAPSGSGGAPSASPSGGSTTSAKAMVDAQMRAVLGRNTGSGGVAGTLAALDRSFQLIDDDGVDSWVWQPQSYAVQSDIGAGVTGEQASLARLAASVGNEILPLVVGLTPLIPEARVNPDEIAAAKAIFAETWPALAGELASDGGPRIARAKRLLSDGARQLVTVGILLGMYKSKTSLANTGRGGTNNKFQPFTLTSWPAPDRSNGVVTGDDEANYTNFLIATERIQLVVTAFANLYVTGGGAVPANEDRGFLVTLLQRAIEATGEAADDVYAALDSVNLGQDEREVSYVPGTDPSNKTNAGPGLMSVEDILSWASEFPQQEATSLLQDAGNVGIQSIKRRARGLRRAVRALHDFATDPAPPPKPRRPPGLTHPRVIYALDLLRDTLDDVLSNARNKALKYTLPKTP